MRIEMTKVWVVSLNTYINCGIYMLPSVNKCKLNAIIFSKLYIYNVHVWYTMYMYEYVLILFVCLYFDISMM